MITHDIDEAILLSDRIVLMTNGPEARVCEIVENTLPKTRTRSDITPIRTITRCATTLSSFW